MKVIILVLGFLLGACSSQVHPDKRQIRYYQEIIGLYPPDLVLGFPNKIDKRADVITHFQFPRGKYLNYIHLGLSLDDNETQSLKTELVAKESVEKSDYVYTFKKMVSYLLGLA